LKNQLLVKNYVPSLPLVCIERIF